MTTRWGILATGNIAHKLADAVVASDTSELTAVGSRTQDAADEFAKEYGLSSAGSHGSYQALIEDSNVDAIYVSTPHPMHAEWTIKALEAGKAVLCEKPMGVNHPEVMAMVETAAFHRRFLMEAFMYRTHPQTAKAVELIRDGAIGEVRQMNMSFGFASPFNPRGRLHANELAGGGIMDVGCYPVSMARLVAGEEPDAVVGFGQLSQTGVDAWAAALLRFPSGAIARVSTAVQLGLDNAAEVFGSEGSIRIASPWMGSRPDGNWSFELRRDGKRETIAGKTKPLYVHEVDAVAEALDDGALESACMDWEDSLGNARVLDLWRREAGVQFDLEKPDRCTVPVHGRPLAVRRRTIPGSEVAGVGKPVSRLVMGCDNQPDILHASVMWDNYFEYGGNTFDTAHIYGGGRMEQLLGTWMANRGIRDDVVVIGKGAHTPANFPDRVGPQLDVTLERLGTDHIDLYFLHRDNTEVPVGEWIDVLNAERSAGRIRAFGGSNWSLSRVQAANAYATAKGLTPFAAVSNNFSLARMVDPVWAGCIASSTAEWRAWLEAEQLALFPWSSQARGFFTSRFDAIRAASGKGADGRFFNQPSDAELERCWFADDNFERRARAVALADERGVEPINVALAYVLSQPFPCFALFGPRVLAETRSSLAALGVELNEAERRWLNLETDSR
ncbi:MAG: aldo/keto reductase [Gammaproteobacteria bacterium]|nr:aldo/keto reductase [Gammaproteobacteria bacterium]